MMFEIYQEEFDAIVNPIYQALGNLNSRGRTSSHQVRELFEQLGAEPLINETPFTELVDILGAVQKTAAYRKAASMRASNEIDCAYFEKIVKQLCKQFRELLAKREQDHSHGG